MQECTSTSRKTLGVTWLTVFLTGLVLVAPTLTPSALAQDRTLQPEEDDHSSTPFTRYGEFNDEDEEAAETEFMQHGRFFGVSLGVGLEGATGNRGGLWRGGFPSIDVKAHYWFDFNFALDLGIFTSPHHYDIDTPRSDHADITMTRIGVDLKYYFETKNASAAITFINPYLLLGAGSYSLTQTSTARSTSDSDSSFGLAAGAGIEIAIKPKRVYFALESKFHLVTFKDTYTTLFSPTFADMTGYFYTLSGGLMFTW